MIISVIAWIFAVSAWVVILGAPVALAAVAVVPGWRRRCLRPLRRRRAARRARAAAMSQARRDARTIILEGELDAFDEPGLT